MRTQEIKRDAPGRWLAAVLPAPVPVRVNSFLSDLRVPTWSEIVRAALRLFSNEWAFGALLVLCYGFFFIPAGTNTTSRYDMVYALLHGTAIIDVHAYNTIDVSWYNSHYYSPRSVGLSLLGVPVLWVLSLFHNIDNQNPNSLTLQIAFINMFTVVPVAVAGTIALYRFAQRLRPRLIGTPLPMVVAGLCGLATLAFPFATTYFSHAFGGALAFIGFYLIYRSRTHEKPLRWLLAAGLLVGFAVISEYPTGIVMAVLAGYIWLVYRGQRFRALAAYVVGMVPSVLILAWYNWFAFGSPLHLSYAYVADEEFAGQHTGFFGITYPQLDSLWSTLVYPRGLLLSSPFLVLGVLGLYRWLRAQRADSAEVTGRFAFVKRWLRHDYTRGTAAEGVVCLAISILYPLVVASYFLPMAGENMPGPRLLVPMLPFACLPLIWVVDDARRWLRALLAVGLVYGVALAFTFVVLGVRVAHTYSAFPFLDLYLPALQTGHVPSPNGPTPLNLGQYLLHIPLNESLWLPAIPLAIWTALAVAALLMGAPARRLRRRPPQSLPRPRVAQHGESQATAPEMVATTR